MAEQLAAATAEVDRLHSFEARVMPLADLEIPGMSIFHDDAIQRLRDERDHFRRLAESRERVWEAALTWRDIYRGVTVPNSLEALRAAVDAALEDRLVRVPPHNDNTGASCRNASKSVPLSHLDHDACYVCGDLLGSERQHIARTEPWGAALEAEKAEGK